jgi:hypothetical protein
MALKGWLVENGIKTVVSHRRIGNPNRGRLIVGWGAKGFGFAPYFKDRLINEPRFATTLACKRKFFDAVSDKAAIPVYTADPAVALAWNSDIVCRATTTGHSGVGITIVSNGDGGVIDLPRVPLYVKYQKKTQEYRVHCFSHQDGWKLEHFQKKIFIKTEERPVPLDWKVRNHAQGFTFQTVEEIPAQVASVCNAVLDDLDVDFCALDVIHHKPTDTALVLEGNTAPGLEDGRLVVYGNYLKTRYEEFKNNAV